MRSDDLLETLVDLDVLAADGTGETLSVAPAFADSVQRTRAALTDHDDLRAGLAERFEDERVVDALARVGNEDLDFVAYVCALAERGEDLSRDDLVRTVAVLRQLRGTVPRTEGVPDFFLPVQGDQLATLLQFAPRSIVYVWQADCEPCDLMRETFEEVLGEESADVALFAVYGPDAAEFLYEEYDVAGAPTTLFMLGDRVDSRLHGAHYPQAIEGELATIADRTVTS